MDFSSELILPGTFHGDDAKRSRVQNLYDRLMRHDVKCSTSLNVTPINENTVSVADIVLILNELPHFARVQVLVRAVAPSPIGNSLIKALYAYAYAQDEVVSEEGDLVDWEFVEEMEKLSFQSTDEVETTTLGQPKQRAFLNGLHFHILACLVTAAPRIGEVGDYIFRQYLATPAQRYRLYLLRFMIGSNVVADSVFLEAGRELPLPVLTRLIKQYWSSHRELRQDLLDSIIKERYWPVCEMEGIQTVEEILTLGSASLLQSLNVMVLPEFEFSRWEIHEDIYISSLKAQMAEFKTDIIARGEFLRALCNRMVGKNGVLQASQAWCLLTLSLDFPCYIISSNSIPSGNATKRENFVNELKKLSARGVLQNDPSNCTQIERFELPAKVCRRLDIGKFLTLVESHIVVHDKTNELYINNHQIFNVLNAIVHKHNLTAKQKKYGMPTLIQLTERVFQTATTKTIATLFLSVISPTPTQEIQLFNFCCDLYHRFVKSLKTHTQVSALARSWLHMHLRFSSTDMEHFTLKQTDMYIENTWVCWHSSCVKHWVAIITSFTSVADILSHNVSMEKRKPSALVSVLGLLDAILAYMQLAWRKLAAEAALFSSQQEDQSNAFSADSWWHSPTKLRKLLWTALQSTILKSVQLFTNKTDMDIGHINRKKPYEYTALAPELMKALTEDIITIKLENMTPARRDEMTNLADNIWRLISQRVSAAENLAFTSNSQVLTWDWLRKWIDLCIKGQEQGLKLGGVHPGGKVNDDVVFIWSSECNALQEVTAQTRSMCAILFQTQLKKPVEQWQKLIRTKSSFAVCDKNKAFLEEPLQLSLELAWKSLQTPLYETIETWDGGKLSPVLKSSIIAYFTLMGKLPVYMIESDLTKFTEVLKRAQPNSNDALGEILGIASQYRVSVTPIIDNILKNLQTSYANDYILKQKRWWSLASISIPIIKSMYEQQSSSDADERATNYILFLSKSYETSCSEYAATLKSVQTRIRGERGSATVLIYNSICSTMPVWLEKLLGAKVTEPETAQSIFQTIMSMIQIDMQRLDSVASRGFYDFPLSVLKIVLGVPKLSPTDFAVHAICIQALVKISWLLAAKQGDKGFQALKFPKVKINQDSISTLELENILSSLKPFIGKQQIQHIHNILCKFSYPSYKASKNFVSAEECVTSLIKALDNVRKEELLQREASEAMDDDDKWLEGSSCGLTENHWLDDTNVLSRIKTLLYITANRYLESPTLVELIRSVSDSLNDDGLHTTASETQTALHFEHACDLFLNTLVPTFTYWYCIPLLVDFCNALFYRAMTRIQSVTQQSAVTLHEQEYAQYSKIYSHILNHWITIQRHERLRNWFLSLPFSDNPRIYAFFVRHIATFSKVKLNNFFQIDLVDDAEIATRLLVLANFKCSSKSREQTLPSSFDQSIIHVPIVKSVLLSKRTDLLDYFLFQENTKFFGAFKFMAGEPVSLQIQFANLVTSSIASSLTGEQAAFVAPLVLRSAMSVSASPASKQHSLQVFCAWPSVDHMAFIELLSDLVNGGSDKLMMLETMLLRALDHDGCMLILSWVLSPTMIAKIPQRLILAILERLPSQFRHEQFTHLLGVLLSGKRRKVIGVVFHKAVIRLLASCSGSDKAALLLWREWMVKDLHEDVQTECIIVCIKLVCGDTSEPNDPLNSVAWRILEAVSNSPRTYPLLSIAKILTVTLEIEEESFKSRKASDVLHWTKWTSSTDFDIPLDERTESTTTQTIRDNNKRFEEILNATCLTTGAICTKSRITADRLIQLWQTLYNNLKEDLLTNHRDDEGLRAIVLVRIVGMKSISMDLVETLENALIARADQLKSDVENELPIVLAHDRYADEKLAELMGMICYSLAVRKYTVAGIGESTLYSVVPEEPSMKSFKRVYTTFLEYILNHSDHRLNRLWTRQVAYSILTNLAKCIKSQGGDLAVQLMIKEPMKTEIQTVARETRALQSLEASWKLANRYNTYDSSW